jgi:hypothetical protein
VGNLSLRWRIPLETAVLVAVIATGTLLFGAVGGSSSNSPKTLSGRLQLTGLFASNRLALRSFSVWPAQ